MRRLGPADLASLSWQDFHELVAILILGEVPGAERLRGADGGADVLHRGRREAWQAKRFSGRMRWEQCERSLDAAVAKHSARAVVFVFALDMSQPAIETFERRLGRRHAGVRVSHIAGSRLIEMLRARPDSEELAEQFFGPDPREQARALAGHLLAQGLRLAAAPRADRLAARLAGADEAARADRLFRTEVALSTGKAPPPRWAEPPALTLRSAVGERALRIAAWHERAQDAEEPLVELCFERGDRGLRARERIARELAAGRQARLPEGVSARLRELPEAMRAAAGAPDEELGDVTLASPPAHPMRLIAEHGGKLIEREMRMRAVPPLLMLSAASRVAAFGCLDGQLALFVELAPGEESLRLAARLSLEPGEAAAGAGLAQALRLLAALAEGEGQIELPGLGRLPLPGPRIGARESAAALRAAEVIESRAGHYELSAFGAPVPRRRAAELRREGPQRPLARFPVSAEVLGHTLQLGIGEARLPPPGETTEADAPDPAKRLIELRWPEPASVPFTLVAEPGAGAPEVGLWPAGGAPAASG